LAPALVFTSEEAWLARFPSTEDSVHLQAFPDIPDEYSDVDLAGRWKRVREIRRVITGALEVERSEKRIGSSLEARVALYLLDEKDLELVGPLDMAELTISSEVLILIGAAPEGAYYLEGVEGVFVKIKGARGSKCGRCWQYSEDVGNLAVHPELCGRCCSVIEQRVAPSS
jgi:isoleucyl-tRNA synthetase